MFEIYLRSWMKMFGREENGGEGNLTLSSRILEGQKRKVTRSFELSKFWNCRRTRATFRQLLILCDPFEIQFAKD